MKKIIAIVLCIVASHAATESYGQIKVHSNGNITVGTTAPSSWKIRMYGNMYTDYMAPSVVNNRSWMASPFLTVGESYTTAYRLRVGGEASSGYTFYVNGSTWSTTGWHSPSDKRVKKNIQGIDRDDIMTKIMSLEGKTYEFDSPEELRKMHEEGVFKFPLDTIYEEDSLHPGELNLNKIKKIRINTPVFPSGRQFGVLSQDVLNVFPSLVKLDSASGMYGVNYDGFIPILLEGIKAQQNRINSLESELQEIKNQLGLYGDKPKKKSAGVDADDTGEAGSGPVLYQNQPNPFNTNTKISLFLPGEIIEAKLYIYDLQGLQKKSINIPGRGDVDITINANELNPGMYIYSLIADGKEIGTKRMIL